jgi:hypothetical protein
MKCLLTIILSIYNLCIIGGTAYLVEVHKWSPLWFAMTILLLMTIDLLERK